MKIVFFRTPKPRQFSYPARYYDKEKERWENRKRELGLSGEKADFQSKVSANWKRFKKTDQTRKKKAEMSVLIYLFIVAILIYFIFFA
ncbi:MAG: hypothetical protein K8S16_09855 [Bacteroidales bacterium]|nr:hypothetical protein [Bacteroidales bacterium]